MADTSLRGIRKVYKFTCYTPRGCSVVDYLILSSYLYSKITYFSVGELCKFFYHCPLTLSINFSLEQGGRDKSESGNIYMCPLIKHLYWNEQARVKFDQAIKLNNNEIQQLKVRMNTDSPHILAEDFHVVQRSISEGQKMKY